jgi:hypothetical protein
MVSILCGNDAALSSISWLKLPRNAGIESSFVVLKKSQYPHRE